MRDQEGSESDARGPSAALRLAVALLLAGSFGCARTSEAPIEIACGEIAPRGATARAPAPDGAAGSGSGEGGSDGRATDGGAPGGGAPGDGARAVGVDDPLELVVRIDSVPAGPGSLHIRVDGLAEPGVVAFSLPPATAAAAAMALTTAPRFQGCAALAAEGLELRAPVAPLNKAWVRVSTDRTVRVHALAAGRRAASVSVAPGSSGIVAWAAGAP